MKKNIGLCRGVARGGHIRRRLFEPLEDRRLMAVGAAMVADVGTEELGSDGRDFVEVHGLTYFLADDGYQTGLWVTDGTTAGTRKAAELMPSPVVDIESLFAADDRLFYLSGDPGLGLGRGRLWVVDPMAGTELEVALPTYNSISEIVPLDHGVAISLGIGGGWNTLITDGSAAGTIQLPFFLFSATSGRRVVSEDGVIYWEHVKDDGGVEIWRADGAATGTHVVATFHSIDELPATELFGADSANLYFANSGFADERGLYRYALDDGDVEQLLESNWAPVKMSRLGAFTLIAARDAARYDAGTTSLWRTDGSFAGTEHVKAIAADYESIRTDFEKMGGTLYFTISRYERNDVLWRTDGTRLGTSAIAKLTEWYSGEDETIVATDSHVFVTSSNNLWISDGTLPGTHNSQLQLAYPPYGHRNLYAAGDRAYFNVQDEGIGDEPWTSNGQPTGTTLLANLNKATSDIPALLNSAAVGGESFYFLASVPLAGYEIRRLDLVSGQTQVVAQFPRGVFQPWRIIGTVNDRILFSTFNNFYALSLASLQVTMLLPADQSYSIDNDVAFVDGKLLFSDGRGQIWSTDGTAEGTSPIVSGYEIEPTWNAGGLTYFGNDDVLYATDGTAAGTRRILEGRYFSGFSHQLVELNGKVYFAAGGDGLWTTDGTAQGTSKIKDLLGGALYLTAVGDRLFFVSVYDNKRQFWTSDGTSEGTVPLEGAPSFRGGAGMVPIVSLGELAIFANTDDEHGSELWVSDGTAAGTKLLVDINQGPGGSAIRDIVVVRGTAFFSAYDPEHGFEPWMSDGTVAGTRRIADIKPGRGSSSPIEFMESSGQVYFRANDGEHGMEVWRITVPTGDANFDGAVNLTDLNVVRNTFGDVGDSARGDVNGDGVVGIHDLNAVRNHFSTATSSSTTNGMSTRRAPVRLTLIHRQMAADAVFDLLTATPVKRAALRRS